MLGNHQFNGVLGVDTSKKLLPFKTWNGSDSIFILDGNGNPAGIATQDEIDFDPDYLVGRRETGQTRLHRKEKPEQEKESEVAGFEEGESEEEVNKER